MPRKPVGPTDEQWQQVIEVASRPQGATAQEVAQRLGHKNPKGYTSKLLSRMLEAGAVVRIRLPTQKRGTLPFAYLKV